MAAQRYVDNDKRHQTHSAAAVQKTQFRISPNSILECDPINDGKESISLNKYSLGDKKGNPVVVEGYGKRDMYAKKKKDDSVPDSNRVIPGMPGVIKSKSTENDQVYVRDSMIATDADLQFKDLQLQGPQYTTAQQIVLNGKPIAWSNSTTRNSRSGLNSVAQSSVLGGANNETSITQKYDPSAATAPYESTKDRVNKLMDAVNSAVSQVKAPTESKAFTRSEEETKALTFSAVPFQPWVASKIMPLKKFDPNQPYIPMQVDFKQENPRSIIEDHTVLNNPIVNKRYRDFNRSARGYNQ